MTIAHRNIRVFFWATLLGSVSFLEPVLTLFYQHRGLTAREIMFALTAFSATMLICEVPTGAFADRFGPKYSFLVGSAIQVLSTVVMIYAHSAWVVFLSRSLYGLACTFFSGADEALIYESLKECGEESQMSAVLGRLNSGAFIAMLVTQLVGAFAAADLTERQFVWVLWATVAFQLGQMLLLFGVVDPASFAHFRDNPLAHVREGFATIRRTPDLVRLFLNVVMVFIPTYVFISFIPPYFTDAGLPPRYLGVLYGAAAVISLLLSNKVDWFTARFSRVAVLYGTGFLILLSIAGAALLHSSILVATVAFLVLHGARTIRNPVASHMQNEYIPSGSRATTLSLLSMVDSAFDVLIVPPLALWAAPFGRPVIFAGCAAVVLLGLLLRVREAPPLAEDAGDASCAAPDVVG